MPARVLLEVVHEHRFRDGSERDRQEHANDIAHKAAHALANGTAHKQRHNHDRWMHVNRILHEFGANERVYELLHAYGEHEREHGGNGAHEQADHGRNRAANPGTHNGNQIQNACNQAQRGSIRHAQHREPYAARHANDKALQHGSANIAAHDAREGDAQHVGLFFMILGHEPIDLAIDRGQFHKRPKRHHERKAQNDEDIRDARTEQHHAIGRLLRDR